MICPPSLTPAICLEIFSSPYSLCPFETHPSWQMCAIILKIFMVRWFVANFFSILITRNCVFVENQKCGKNAHSNTKAKSSINRKSLRRFLCKFLWNQITKAFVRTHAFKHTHNKIKRKHLKSTQLTVVLLSPVFTRSCNTPHRKLCTFFPLKSPPTIMRWIARIFDEQMNNDDGNIWIFRCLYYHTHYTLDSLSLSLSFFQFQQFRLCWSLSFFQWLTVFMAKTHHCHWDRTTMWK